MSLKPRCFDLIPEETVRAAQAAFPKGNVYLRMRDEFGMLYADEAFAELFSTRGQPAEAPGCLALVMVMQFAEGLSDRQAADAVRARIDWKYALGLELTDPGFDASVLSEFRSRLVAGGAEAVLFETLVERCRQAGLIKARTRQRTDSTHVLAAVQMLNRLECVGETLRHALNVLAVVEPDWLPAHVPPLWFERYDQRFADYRLPAERTERYALAETIGTDGFALLDMIYAATAPGWLREVPAVEVLRQVWVQQFYGPDEQVRWRAASDLPPSAELICSPYDAEARYAKKRSVVWVGYKVHLTETCDEDTVHLITDVQTTPATTADSERLPTIQADLAARQLLPAEQIVDAGYVTAEHLVTSQQTHQINLLGPVMPDTSWQAQAPDRFDVATFVIDWEAQTATCPQGQVSRLWQPSQSQHGQPVIRIHFARTDCQVCPVHPQCTHSPHQGRRLTVRPRDQHEALQAARQRQTTEPFKDAYAARAGVEGTLSQGVRDCNLRRSRYIGLVKTRLHHLLAATAINLLRIGAWLAGRPRAKTRRSAFAALAPALS
jgi:transposase